MNTKSQNQEIPSDPTRWTGYRFGRLVVEAVYRSSNRRGFTIRVRCRCGKKKTIRASVFRDGRAKSCGCGTGWHKHGMSRSNEYAIWANMIDRCLNSRNSSYARYGGRGIRVCSAWRESFENFYRDVGPRPSLKHSLDRFPDNNGNYEPGNIRWATRREQQNNTSRNRFITTRGLTLTVAEWARRSGNLQAVISDRLDKNWDVDRAIFLAPLPRERDAATGRYI